jgi:hypothetical protein
MYVTDAAVGAYTRRTVERNVSAAMALLSNVAVVARAVPAARAAAMTKIKE